MTVQCFACSAFRLKGSDLAKHGFGTCKHSKDAGQFVSAVYPRTCMNYEPAPEDVAEERKRYIDGDKKRGKD